MADSDWDDNTAWAAYGGEGWSPRTADSRDELGPIWATCGLDSEWGELRHVLLHAPGAELLVEDANCVQMVAVPDLTRAQAQHHALVNAYREAGVTVSLVAPPVVPPPNQLFVADLFWSTPWGAVLARPASTVRAGEERWVARRLVELGVPIVRSVSGTATFEGADALWLSPTAVLLATGPRTNEAGAAQVTGLLAEMGVRRYPTHLPPGTMHLMGVVRLLSPTLAVVWKQRVPETAVAALRATGYDVHFLPDETEARLGHALNVVTLRPNHILMAADNPHTRDFYEALGVRCTEVEVSELLKAAGGIGCMSGVVERESTTDEGMHG